MISRRSLVIREINAIKFDVKRLDIGLNFEWSQTFWGKRFFSC